MKSSYFLISSLQILMYSIWSSCTESTNCTTYAQLCKYRRNKMFTPSQEQRSHHIKHSWHVIWSSVFVINVPPFCTGLETNLHRRHPRSSPFRLLPIPRQVNISSKPVEDLFTLQLQDCRSSLRRLSYTRLRDSPCSGLRWEAWATTRLAYSQWRKGMVQWC